MSSGFEAFYRSGGAAQWERGKADVVRQVADLLLGLQPSSRILDFGCGTGWTAPILAAKGENLGQVALTMFVFGLGAALPLMLLGFLSRKAMMRWRGRMMEAGKGGKMLLGVVLVAIGLIVATGLDKRIETMLVDASPAWLTELTTRF